MAQKANEGIPLKDYGYYLESTNGDGKTFKVIHRLRAPSQKAVRLFVERMCARSGTSIATLNIWEEHSSKKNKSTVTLVDPIAEEPEQSSQGKGAASAAPPTTETKESNYKPIVLGEPKGFAAMDCFEKMRLSVTKYGVNDRRETYDFFVDALEDQQRSEAFYDDQYS